MLKAGIEIKYQTSNTAGLQGWHNAMTVEMILAQLETNYGRPDPSAIQANETKWNAPHNPNESPETLFHRMEKCQEVAMLADNEYTEKRCGARVGGALCYINKPTLRLKNQRVFTFGALGAS